MTNNIGTFRTTVAFVGLPNVGKSTLLNALIGVKIAPTSRKPQTTRKIIRGIKTIENCQQVYFDTPGSVRKRTTLDQFMQRQIFHALSGVEQVVAIVDAHDPASKHISFLESVMKAAISEQQNFILVINKIDAIKNKEMLLKLMANYAGHLGAKDIIPISAVKLDGLDSLFQTIKTHAKPGSFLFDPELFTDASEKDIVAELIREKAMLELKQELPYRLAVSIEDFDESGREDDKKPIISIEAVIHVERGSQKAIVIGENGATIRTIGIRARKELEYLLQCQVMLKLFVRVEPNWTNRKTAMKKLGY